MFHFFVKIRDSVEHFMLFRVTRQQATVALMVIALVYAFLAGFHTVFDLDMGWHLATGRYVVQHHVVPSTDVLSYTSPEAQWIYPPFAGVLLYGIFSAFGYKGLSWFCAMALMAMVACLLRSPSRQESGPAAALAIIAVPELSLRALPRADLFTNLFFAVFLVQLWAFHSSNAALSRSPMEPISLTPGAYLQHVVGTTRRLWTLPVVMLLWVNLHPGFVAGLGMLFAYLLIEGLELPFSRGRSAALERLKQAWPPLAATLFATLFNPYGLRIFKASILLAGLQRSSLPSTGPSVKELTAVPLSFTSFAEALDWRNPASSYWWLALAAVLVITLALWRRQFGATLLMATALYFSIQHLRYKSLFACIVVVVGSTIFAEALLDRRRGSTKVAAKRFGLLRLLPVIAASVLCLLTCVRIVDLASDRSYLGSDSEVLFGPGESWWFPERAAAFIQREHFPGNIFQLYNLGGFTAWRLGPAYRDFIDGRNVSHAVWEEQQELLSSPLDSPVWEAESDRRSINILFFSLARFYGLGDQNLLSLCQSQLWRPIYMDEVSLVLLRNRSENRPWIDRYEVNCQSHNFAPPLHASRGELSNFYANAGAILLLLGRYNEAQEVLDHAVAISPESPSVHLALARLYDAKQQLGDAEREFKAALSVKKNDAAFWDGLGRFYYSHGRYADARPYILTAAQLSTIPINEYTELGYIDLELRQPHQALIDYAKAEEAEQGREDLDPEFLAQIAEGRAVAYLALGERQRAIELLQEAIRRTPKSASRWQALGDLYDAVGRQQLAEQALEQAHALSK